ncbi:hypothetical protein BP5796_06750 [Coleophoma crateriformis]|uniref:Choline monooxygenase, chloroplastic n=1 Tax=Coleophoma crateriformis TaxID=565419 RepID=A0A3D8RPF2_9HELO|nr:hypothetical protein BP5796_06750 [Coleophoma crateriformis]
MKDSGSTTVLACKFHGWTYLPTGALHTAREYMELPNFNASEHSLFKIHTHVTAQGFIFVNFDASPSPSVPFSFQFGDDFDPTPEAATGKEIGDKFALFPPIHEWVYDHTWLSESAGTNYNWKTFADGFQECYHCATGHPTTLPKDFCLNEYYLRQGHGSSRHFLPSADSRIKESYITWLYPIGAIIFSEDLLFIARFDARGALDTRYQSETYRRKRMAKDTDEHKHWMDKDIEYWRFVEREDVELAVNAQKGFANGILAKGRLHPLQEHAVKWYQDKLRASLVEHKQLENDTGGALDYSLPNAEKEWEDKDPLCKLMGSELEW